MNELGKLVDFVCEMARVVSAAGGAPNDDSDNSTCADFSEVTNLESGTNLDSSRRVILRQFFHIENNWRVNGEFLVPNLPCWETFNYNENGDLKSKKVRVIDGRTDSFFAIIFNVPSISALIFSVGKSSHADRVRVGCYLISCIASAARFERDLIPLLAKTISLTRLAYSYYCENERETRNCGGCYLKNTHDHDSSVGAR